MLRRFSRATRSLRPNRLSSRLSRSAGPRKRLAGFRALWFLAYHRRWQRRMLYAVLFLFIAPIALFSYLTNPFVQFSLVTDPHPNVSLQDGELNLGFEEGVLLQDDLFFRQLARLKSAWHIVGSRFGGGKKTTARTVDEIVREIHRNRFNPDEPYLISGDHFSVLYPRSLGIFYHSLLDPRTALDETDWQNRQRIYLKTLAYALEVYAQTDQLSTTIVPVGPRSVALMNIYAPPSDTLYSLLLALKYLQSSAELEALYPFAASFEPSFERMPSSGLTQPPPLETASIAAQLRTTYHDALQHHLERQQAETYDATTGLIRTDILLSGTKDIMKRQGSFYDNVIWWKTQQLAQELDLLPRDQQFLDEYKQRILQAYWQEDGFFLEDLSEQARAEGWYSSDWLVVVMTGFLDPSNPDDLPYLQQAVAYIRRNAIDQPFAIQYHPDAREERLYGLVRLAAPAYGSTTLWSNWGMEYVKLLIRLAQVTGDESHLTHAEAHLDSYAFNIKRYRGYPEVYNAQGDFFRNFLYKSVRQTGWVVSYEQARAMFAWTKEGWGK